MSLLAFKVFSFVHEMSIPFIQFPIELLTYFIDLWKPVYLE